MSSCVCLCLCSRSRILIWFSERSVALKTVDLQGQTPRLSSAATSAREQREWPSREREQSCRPGQLLLSPNLLAQSPSSLQSFPTPPSRCHWPGCAACTLFHHIRLKSYAWFFATCPWIFWGSDRFFRSVSPTSAISTFQGVPSGWTDKWIDRWSLFSHCNFVLSTDSLLFL